MDEVRGDGSCMRGPRKSSYSHANGNCVEVGNWRKSSLSFANGNCVEVGTYRKSRHSESGNCVEVGRGNGVGVRDTTQEGQPGRTEIEFPPAAWRAFTRRLKTP
jgi:hypothetical protein